MSKMLLLVVVLIIIGVILYGFFSNKKPQTQAPADGHFISTQSQTNDRVAKLGMDKPTEDASYILDKSRLTIPKGKEGLNQDGYRANLEMDCVIAIDLPDGGAIKKSDLNNLFDRQWRTDYEAATVYGYSTVEKRWTFAMAGDGPEVFDKLEIGVNLLELYNERKPDYDPTKLKRYITKLEEKLTPYHTKIIPHESVEKALVKAKGLVELNHEFDIEAVIVLKGKAPFDGLKAWDALICTGLKWGDGDLFHWENYHTDYGDEILFSVGTNTQPRYFLPEDVKAGQMNPDDLIFGFSVPRSVDPEGIFKAMLNTVKYCQKRLGGEILDKYNQPFDETKEIASLEALVSKMKINGIVPGSDKSLQMY